MKTRELQRPSSGDSGTAQAVGGRGRLAVAFITLLAIGTDLFVVSPLLPNIADQYGISTATAGNSVTVFSIAYMVGAPFIGSLADRMGRRTVLIAGLIGFCLANALTGIAPNFGVLLAARVLAGLAASGVTPSVQALVGQSAPAERRGSWMAVAAAGFLISLSIGAPTGTAVASLLSWRETFLGIGILAAILAVLNVFAWPKGAGEVVPAAPQTAGAAAVEHVGLLDKVRAVTVTGLWAFAVYSLYTYIGTGLRDVAGLSTGFVATALFVYGIGAVVGSLSGGRLADRYGSSRVVVSSLILLSVLEVLLDLAFHAPTAVLIAALGLFALVAFPCLPAYQSRLVTAFPRVTGSVMAWNSCFMYLGTSLGAAAGGVLLSSAGFSWIAPVGAVVALLGALVYARWALPRDTAVDATA
ncbi:MFS transporter [Streptomyces sp. NBC_00893]|uniref:MFS transporter n=1 Tax=Streptomyces sp. NBC_00893 TaxID=2975862 RepID=UPI00224EE0E1|nr:MFS transporter [Streptomyces sp. NBC_00893]MCX4844618.1 MFS transporter [Streptomyces sp. NBC_00893]